jgi:hypothetical protein
MSREDEGTPVECAQPVSAAVLADYWMALLTEPEEEAVEEHLLACDQCGRRMRDVIALADGIRRVAREGSLRMIVSDSYLERAAAHGLRVREYAPEQGGSVRCTVTEDDDLLIGRLVADMSGSTRVDLSLCDARGVEQVRLADIPVHAGARGITFQESITSMKAAPTMTMVARLIGFDPAGGERLLGEYTFHHERSIPGPPGWDAS